MRGISCLISLLPDVVDPTLAVRRHISVISEVLDILNKSLSLLRSLSNCDVHEELPAGQDRGGIGGHGHAVPRLKVKAVYILRYLLDLVAGRYVRYLPSRRKIGRSVAAGAYVYDKGLFA
jgi:hypothetical protein